MLDGMLLRPYHPRTPNSVRYGDPMHVPMLTPAPSMRTSPLAALMPRGAIAMPPLSILGDEEVCLWEEDGRQCEVFFGG